MHSTRIEKRKKLQNRTPKKLNRMQESWSMMSPDLLFFLQLDSEFYNEPMFARQTAKLATLITLPLTMIHGRNGHFYHK